jgi:hypothetical protein
VKLDSAAVKSDNAIVGLHFEGDGLKPEMSVKQGVQDRYGDTGRAYAEYNELITAYTEQGQRWR